MFIYSVRASTVRFFAVIVLTLAALIGVVAAGSAGSVFALSTGVGTYRYNGVGEQSGRVAFLAQFGIEVDAASEREESFTMPADFDRVMLGYNEIQKAQGLDVSKYKNKKVSRYTYEVTNAKDAGGVMADLLVYRDRVIGCDVASADPNGYVRPLTEFEGI